MGVLDAYKEQIYGYFSDWIKVNDKSNTWTIEDFPYSIGVDEDTIKPHCWKCVTVNNCWFKNEENKKPDISTMINTLMVKLANLYEDYITHIAIVKN